MRIRAAAQVVCSYYWLATETDKARCVRDATADAVTKINQPALSALYNAKNR
jgi:UrcA family protein